MDTLPSYPTNRIKCSTFEKERNRDVVGLLFLQFIDGGMIDVRVGSPGGFKVATVTEVQVVVVPSLTHQRSRSMTFYSFK